MRIGFDGRDLLRKRTGVVNYTVHLAREGARRPDATLLVYADTYADPDVPPPADVPLRRLPAPPLAWKHAALPLALRRDRADLFHSPTGTLPLWAPCPQVVTIHDLFAVVGPDWFPGRMAATLAGAQRRAARAAAAIVAVSHTTRRDLVERLGVPEERIQVVHNGVDHERFSPSPLVGEDPDAVAGRYGARRPFVLCVGSLLPWRNAPRLLRAVAAARAQHRLEVDLLFVGRNVWGTDPTATIARETGWDAWAHVAGYVSDEDLPALYRAAALFAAPSLYEGFGIPPLEAMASGVPVVASTAGAMPEVLGHAALLADPLDEAGLAEALYAALADGPLRGRLRERGLARARHYSWARAVDETWQVYLRALGRA